MDGTEDVYKRQVYPLPMKLIREFSQKVERLIVVEELEGLIEREVLAAGIACEGKSLTGIQGCLLYTSLRRRASAQGAAGGLDFGV